MNSDIYIILKDFSPVFAAILTPFALWQIAKLYQARKEKRDAKLNLFLKLMSTRKKTPVTFEYADALNQIDIVFQDDRRVRDAWRQYYDSLHNNSPHFESNGAFQLDLLSEMANSLNYKDLRQTEIDRYYNPAQLTNNFEIDLAFKREITRVFSQSKNIHSHFTEQEYQEYYESLSDIKKSFLPTPVH